jgi:hypothetical protein
MLSLSGIGQELHCTPDDQIKFFKSIRYSLVLSNLGDINKAAKMSGGDYGKFVFCFDFWLAISSK